MDGVGSGGLEGIPVEDASGEDLNVIEEDIDPSLVLKHSLIRNSNVVPVIRGGIKQEMDVIDGLVYVNP